MTRSDMPPRDLVVVVGAGAAGLAAARELARASVPVLVLEARPRLFGRVHTVRDSRWPAAIDLGAEFIHDDAPLTTALAREGGLPIEVVPERRRRITRNRLVPLRDPDELLKKFLKSESAARDRSLGAVLSDHRGAKPHEIDTVRRYVEGYHAADLDRISARALRALLETPGEGSLQQRPTEGYAALLGVLAQTLLRSGVELRTSTTVTRLAWRRGRVRVTTDRAPVTACAAIVTIPLALLPSGRVAIDPLPSAWRPALSRLEMGPVQKVALLFAEPFWEDAAVRRRLGGGRTPPNFWHSPREAFPTWWTSAPRSTPILTAWAGGPAARAFAHCSTRALANRAIESLAHILGMRRSRLDDLMRDALSHDWASDPWTCGGYSYLGVGGLTAQRRLAKAVDATLVLAGEALDREHIGTVEGALASGRRAARRLLRAWER